MTEPQPAHGNIEGDNSTLRALQLIESIGETEPFTIVPVIFSQGSVTPANELMAAKVKWAQRAGYSVVTTRVPSAFAPYNAVIRVSEGGTEDRMRDYLAHLGEPIPASIEPRARSLRGNAASRQDRPGSQVAQGR